MSWLRRQYNPKLHTLFIPKNIDKYRGNVPLVARSKYELAFCNWCDHTKNVVWWSSENLKIPYFHPIKKKQVGYWPDFILKIQDNIYVVELKPEIQTKPPVYSKRKSLLNEQAIYMTNVAKWNACKTYCEKLGYTFMVIKNESLMAKRGKTWA